MPQTRLRPAPPERTDVMQRWLTSRVGPVLVIALGCVILVAAVGRAAELVAAELEGTTNTVSVEQGGSATFTLTVRASGTIRCNATPSNPATAQLPTVFGVSASGSVSASNLSAPLAFFGTGSGTCNVSWQGDPTPYRLTATVHADLYAPLGDRSIRLFPVLSTPGGSGLALKDDTATLIKFSITPGSDREPPEVTCDGPRSTAGANGWHVEPVAFDCVSVDHGTGLADPADATFTLETDGEGNVSTGIRTVFDVAGNETTVGPFGPYDVDLHDPIVEVAEPTESDVYILGSNVEPSYGCDDTPEGAGVDTCDATPVDTSTVGTKTFQAKSRDRAGRQTTVTRSYDVVYDMSPLESSGPVREQEAGSSLVVRWRIEGQSSRSIVSSLRSAEAACDADGVAPGGTAVDGTPVRYEPGSETFSFTWRTERAWAGTCRQLQITLQDGMTRTMNVSFK